MIFFAISWHKLSFKKIELRNGKQEEVVSSVSIYCSWQPWITMNKWAARIMQDFFLIMILLFIEIL